MNLLHRTSKINKLNRKNGINYYYGVIIIL
jgi:hypothetical protein